MQSLQQAVSSQFWAVRDYLAPVLRDSKFKEHGKITPDEFVAAGDFLTYKFGTWTWEAGDRIKTRDFLPKDKQYLVQRNVPCIRRVKQMLSYGDGDDDNDKETILTFKADELLGEPDSPDDEWVATHTGGSSKPVRSGREEAVDIPDMDPHPSTSSTDSALASQAGNMHIGSAASDKQGEDIPSMDEIPDIDDDDDLGGGVVEPEDEAAAPSASSAAAPVDSAGNVLSVRTYDCYITYDKLWQVPRMWLSGLSPSRQPLTTAELFEDITADYAQKTVTIEPFPHKEGVSMASVHPCKHANVMKKVIERMDGAAKAEQRKLRALEQGGGLGETAGQPEAAAETTKEKKKKGGWGIPSAVKRAAGMSSSGQTPAVAASDQQQGEEVEGLRVDQYLLVFLKFLSNVVPTIELDATTAL